jgi:hypothetical protein
MLLLRSAGKQGLERQSRGRSFSISNTNNVAGINRLRISLQCRPFYNIKLLKRHRRLGVKRYASDGWPRQSSRGFQSLERRSRSRHSTLSRMNGVVGIGRPRKSLRCELICAIKLL